MPALSVWVVRAAFLYLVAGAAVGSALLAAKGGFIMLDWSALRAAHIELLAFGWTANLAFGVGYWILPKHGLDSTRRRIAAAGLIAFNLGIVLAIFAAPGLLVAGRLVQLAGVLAFAAHALGRVAGR